MFRAVWEFCPSCQHHKVWKSPDTDITNSLAALAHAVIDRVANQQAGPVFSL